MRGTVGGSTSPSSIETRHRFFSSTEDPNKRRSSRSKVFKDSDRSSNCKFRTLKVVLVVIVLGTFFMLLHSPAVYNTEHIPNCGSSTTFVDRWTSKTSAVDKHYISNLDVNWDHITEVIEKLTNINEYQGIGLLNFNGSETDQWNQLIPDAEHVVLQLDHVSNNITWESLFPEWIDEEEEFEVPSCPTLPKLQVTVKPRIDLIAVKLPCNKSGKWSRDVARLHLQLAAAKLAAAAKGYYPVHVILVTDCLPIPNLFTCKELVVREGNVWLYEPNLNLLRGKLQLPVGSCELAVPLMAKENWYSGNARREAYATILHSAHVYVCGAIAAAQTKLTTPMNFSTCMGEHYKMIAEPGMPDADMDNKMMENSVGREICVSEGGEMFNLYDERDLIVHEIDGNVEPCIGMEFESEEAAMACYDAYAKRVGFVIRVGNCHRSSRDGSVISRRFLCNKEGFRVNNKKVKRLEVRKPREITREGCKAMIMVRKEKSGKWIVAKLETEHSHPLGIPAGKGRRGTIQARPQDEKDKKIRELSTQLQRANQQLAECQKQLDMVLKDIEQHTSHLTKSIQEIVANVKEVEDEEEDQL